MIFRQWPPTEAVGAINAHKLNLPNRVLKKGHVLTDDDCTAIAHAGVSRVWAARLEPGDMPEDDAATAVAQAAVSAGVRAEAAATGRVNLFAQDDGVLTLDRSAIDAANRIDPAITIATLPEHKPVVAGEMVATIKIIPLAVRGDHVDQVCRVVAGAIGLSAYQPKRIGVISTVLPSLKLSVIAKTLKIMAARLEGTGSEIAVSEEVPHDASSLRAAIQAIAPQCDLLVIFGASAIVDGDDIVPAAIREAGGAVEHFGMPVDPGNLLLLADLDGIPVLGAPGCARSPKENGFDWVLQRLLADCSVTADDIMGMGVGGLLMEIVSRPQPRALPTESAFKDRPRIAGLILAAGRGTRMGGPNKLAQEAGGRTILGRVIDAAQASCLTTLLGVTGHEAEKSAEAFDAAGLPHVHNPDHTEGLSTTLRTGLRAIKEHPEGPFDGVMVLLGDMPMVTTTMMDALCDAFDPGNQGGIVVPVHQGKRGNPVLWGARYIDELIAVRGDVGGRGVLGAHDEDVFEVFIDDPAIFRDIDTPQALDDLKRELGDT